MYGYWDNKFEERIAQHSAYDDHQRSHREQLLLDTLDIEAGAACACKCWQPHSDNYQL